MKKTSMFTRLAKVLAVIMASALFAAAAPAQDANNPYNFEKKAYKPDGTPWTGPVNVGDTVKYVLSYKPGTTPSGPVTIDDQLSPNLSYVAPTTSSPGWTWGSSPYSTGNVETYSHPGFGPGSGNVKLTVSGVPSPPTGQTGDGTIPIPILSENKVFGIYHHSGPGNSLIDCWDLNTLAKCGVPQNNAMSGQIFTPLTPKAVVRGSKFYFAGYKSGNAVIGCFDGATNSACTEIPVPAAVSDYAQVGGLVEDGAGRMFIAVKEKVFCFEGANPVPCTAWTSASITTTVSPTSSSSPPGTEDFVNLLAEHSPSPTRIYVHHGDSVVQCLETATGTPCSGGAWTTAGTSLGGSGSMLSSIPLSGSSGDGGVCLWTHYGVQVGCISNTGTPVSVSHPAFSHPTIVPISSFRIPGTGKVYFPDYFDNGPECIEYSGATGSVCAGFPTAWPTPYSLPGTASTPPSLGLDKGSQYGFALDPKDPQNCMLALGHNNMLWRFEYNTGKIGCGSSVTATPSINDLYCSGAPDPSQFRWTSVTVNTVGANGVLTVSQGSNITQFNVSNGTVSAIPVSFSPGQPLTFSYVPTGGPSSIDIVISYTSDKNPEICYQATVKECGVVSNTAIMKGTLPAAFSASQTVDLGKAVGPKCDPVDPPPVTFSCLSADPKVTCGKTPGTYVVTLNPNSTGSTSPSEFEVKVLTPGVSIQNPKPKYIIGPSGQLQLTLIGANPGDVIEFDISGSQADPKSKDGMSICCVDKIKITIPKDLDCDPKKIVDLAIKKTGKTSPAPQANGYSFALNVTNEGPAFTPASGTLTVTDVVPPGMTFNTITPSAGWACLPIAPVTAGNTITCTYSGGPLAAGPANTIGTINIAATATGQPPFPKFTNCANVGLTGSTTEATLANNKSCVDVVKEDIKKKHDVAIVKKATVNNQAIVTYSFTLDITNKGDPLLAGATVTVTDVVPAGLSFTSVVAPTGWSCSPAAPLAAGSTLTCNYNGGAVAANTAMGSIVIQAQPVTPQNLGPFENCANTNFTTASTLTDVNMADNNSCVVITSEGPPKSSVSSTKVCEPVEEIVGAVNSYQAKCHITVTTTGIITGPVSVAEDFTPLANGNAGSVSYTGSSTGDAWTCTPATVPSGTTMNCTLPGSAFNPASDTSVLDVLVKFTDKGWSQESQNCASATYNGQTTPQSCVPFVLGAQSSISVVKTCGPATAVAGSNQFIAQCNITLTTNGPQSGTVAFNDVLTSTGNLTNFTTTSMLPWACSGSGCSIAGSSLNQLASSSGFSVAVIFPSQADVAGSQNCAQASLNGGAVGQPSCTILTATPPIDVGIKKTGQPSSATPGDPNFDFTLTLTNEANSLVTGLNGIVVTEQVPVGVSVTSITGSSGIFCAPVATTLNPIVGPATVTCNVNGTFAAGPGLPIGTVKIKATSTNAQFTNCASVGPNVAIGGLVDANPANDNSCVTVAKTPLTPKKDDKPNCDTKTAKLTGNSCRCIIRGMVPVSKTSCACPAGKQLRNGACAVPPPPPPKCDGKTAKLNGNRCVCIVRGMVPVSKTSCDCPKGQDVRNGKCAPPPPPPPKCDGKTSKLQGNRCVCTVRGMVPVSKTSCSCRKGEVVKNGACRPERIDCPEGTVFNGKRCVDAPRCRRGQVALPGTGICVDLGQPREENVPDVPKKRGDTP